MKKKKGKVRNEVKNKEEEIEDWCFVCKDGGLLLICDNKNCVKAYHPECVGKDPSFLEAGERWTCSRHSCFICHRSPEFHCIGCPTAVCRRCIRSAEFVNFKRKKSICAICLKLVLLIEENVDIDSEGGKVDFKDRDTYECLFKEYWELIKDKECVSLQDLHSADNLLKKGERDNSESDSDKLFEAEQEDEHLISDFEDNMDDRMEDRPSSLMETPKGLLHATKTMKRKLNKKKEFIGWASRSLIEFLTSIGKDTSKPFAQTEVEDIVVTYIRENKLTHPDKKKKVVCDAMLYSIFRKKSLNRNRIRDLLGPHFAENQDSSDDDEFTDHSEEEEGASNSCKRQRKTSLDRKTNEKDNILVVPRSCFASITTPNIKLVYLKRTLVEVLLKDPDTFEGKVVGSFVRVKCDPNDYFQKNSHQLLLVTGIMKAVNSDSSGEVIMHVSNMNKGLHIRMLSDDDFTEEECEDLHQRVKDGLLKKPTIWELEEKARVLHKNITQHWIERELALLQNLIDRANEKGWRRELGEYLERRKLLQSPSERQKLLDEVPKVIAEELEIEAPSVELPIEDPSRNDLNDDSPRSILFRASETLDDVVGKQTSSNLKGGGTKNAGDGDVYDQKSEVLEGQDAISMSASLDIISPNITGDEHGNGKAINEKVADKAEVQAAIRIQTASVIVISDVAGDENQNGEAFNERGIGKAEGDQQHNSHVSAPEQHQKKSDVIVQGEEHQSLANVSEKQHQKIEFIDKQKSGEVNSLNENKEDRENVEERRNIEVIDLDDDDDEDQYGSLILENPESAIWHYVDPYGDTQGPYSMSMLKQWKEGNYFGDDFKVWKTGQTKEAAILLTDAMAHVFPRNR